MGTSSIIRIDTMLSTIHIGTAKVCSLNIPEFITTFLPTDKLSGNYLIQPATQFKAEDFKYTIRNNYRKSSKRNDWIDFTPVLMSPFLCDDELKKVNAYKVMKKQAEWLAGRFLVKWMIHTFAKSVALPEFDGSPLDRILIDYTALGAPYIVGKEQWGLSISHAGHYAVVALRAPIVVGDAIVNSGPLCPTLSLGMEKGGLGRIGIDIEKIEKMPDTYFMKTAFTKREIDAIKEIPEAAYRCWTAKEAFLKYIGMGFNESLHHVEVLDQNIFFKGECVDAVVLNSQVIHGDYALSLIEGLGNK